nr:MAG TPA: hypothetical protein [Caudoviricetes sp.]
MYNGTHRNLDNPLKINNLKRGFLIKSSFFIFSTLMIIV